MKRKLYENGRSIKVSIPRAYTELIGVQAGEEVGVTVKDNQIVIYKIKDYCIQNDGLCETCSLVNCNKDCHNNELP